MPGCILGRPPPGGSGRGAHILRAPPRPGVHLGAHAGALAAAAGASRPATAPRLWVDMAAASFRTASEPLYLHAGSVARLPSGATYTATRKQF